MRIEHPSLRNALLMEVGSLLKMGPRCCVCGRFGAAT